MTQQATAPLARKAYEELRALILAGGLAPDEPISERGLSERLGLGRTPVREALKALNRDGLVMIIPGRGTFLRTLSLHQLRELYEVRMGIEGIAAYLAAQRGPSPALAAFKPQFEDLLANAGNVPLRTIQDTGTEFHNELVAAAHNDRLLAFHETLRDQIELTMRLTRDHDHSRIHATIGEHFAILVAVLDRDPAAAQQAVYDHLSNAISAGVQIFSRVGAQRLG
ncbi:GntR family transcriptional regulator [Acuticoccus mangrovi]|uniref:GntR family transcriptional regulator n=1 Tax=Acuticoccus mangrovi TaxID=2796142 RepID=A0A934ITH3_9HYPH|nr:GntR family transcriptional regulator [Acuticoccus mangrovi]MBJ3778521.1 GntR family transcriptional regulator [Acuticoccus mangrovi]